MFLQAILNSARKAQIDKYISGEQTYRHKLQIRDNKIIDMPIEQKISIELPHDVDMKIYNQINAILFEVKQKYKVNVQTAIQKKLSVGEKLPNFGTAKKVFGHGTGQLSAKKGQVLLIDIWATWCGPCQGPMAHNQKMLQQNKWGDRVRIIGLSVDDNIENVQQRIKQRGWDKIEHLTLQRWNHNHPIIKQFNLHSIPFVVLADNQGYIRYAGHPSATNLQDTINKILTQQKQGDKQAFQILGESNKQISTQEMDNIINTLSNKQYFQKNFGKLQYFCTQINLDAKVTKGKIRNSASIIVYVNSNAKQELQNYEKLIPSKSVKFEGKIVEIQNVPQTPKNCFSCKSQLKYPLYWCRWSKENNDFRCRNCIQKKQDRLHYIYNQNSILLMSETKQISVANMGNNIQPQNSNIQNLQAHQFGCNFCGNFSHQIGQPRYVCLSCKLPPKQQQDFLDLCETCIASYISKQQDIVEYLKDEGHTDTHSFVRILYNVKNYSQY